MKDFPENFDNWYKSNHIKIEQPKIPESFCVNRVISRLF